MAKFNLKGVGKQIMPSALAVGGGVASKYIPKLIPDSVPATIGKAIPLALGLILAAQKGALSSIGTGMVAVAGTDMLASTLGIGAVDYDDVIEGLYDDEEISGDEADELSGIEEDEDGMGDIIAGPDDVINGEEEEGY